MFRLPGAFSEYRCARCGFVRLDPKPKDIKKYYPPKRYYSYTTGKLSFFGWLRSFLIRHNLLLFVPAMPRSKIGKILDIGCGGGDTLMLLQGLGWEAHGLDIDKNAILAAKKRGLQRVSFGTMDVLKKYPNNFFDAIRLYHVIEHLEDPDTCLRVARQKLKKGGEIIIGTPNIGSLVAKLFGSRWYNLDAPRHLYLFTPKNLRVLVSRNKYSNIAITYSSAGGWIGSIQYLFSEKIDLINRQWLILLFYPLEWSLDRLALGDVFVLRAQKI